MPLTRLPPEILHHILALVDPADLSTVSQTCRFFNDYITGNNPLCREVYLYTLVCLIPSFLPSLSLLHPSPTHP